MSNKKAVTLKVSGKKNSSCKVSVKANAAAKKVNVTAKVGKKKLVCKVTIKASNKNSDSKATNKPGATPTVTKAPETDSAKIKENFEKLATSIDNDPNHVNVPVEDWQGDISEAPVIGAKISKKTDKYIFTVKLQYAKVNQKTPAHIYFDVLENGYDETVDPPTKYGTTVSFSAEDGWLKCNANCTRYAKVTVELTGNVYSRRVASYNAKDLSASAISATNSLAFYKKEELGETETKIANSMLDTAYPICSELVGQYGLTMQDLGFK